MSFLKGEKLTFDFKTAADLVSFMFEKNHLNTLPAFSSTVKILATIPRYHIRLSAPSVHSGV